MFISYDNRNYELNGNWDSDSGQMLLWFPVSDISLKQKEDFDADERTQKLLNELGIITTSPSVSLVMAEDIPDTADNSSMPEIEKSAEQLEGDGLIIIEARYLSQMGRRAVERCGQMIEDVYSDQMFERVQS